jgi:hypothetical protein
MVAGGVREIDEEPRRRTPDADDEGASEGDADASLGLTEAGARAATGIASRGWATQGERGGIAEDSGTGCGGRGAMRAREGRGRRVR